MSNAGPDAEGESHSPNNGSPVDYSAGHPSTPPTISSTADNRDLQPSPSRDHPIAEMNHSSTASPSANPTASALPSFTGSQPTSPARSDVPTSSNTVGSRSPSPQKDNPSQRPGLSSSESFAVSHEITWAQDEFVDPAWGLQRKETDPFQFLGESDRTNSFPEVPPAHHPVSSLDRHALTASEGVGRVHGATHPFDDDDGSYQGYTFPEIKPEMSSGDTSASTAAGEADDDGLDFFDNYGKSQGRNISTPPDYEARYEESVPLLHPLSPSRQQNSSNALYQPSPSDPFGDASQAENLGEASGGGLSADSVYPETQATAKLDIVATKDETAHRPAGGEIGSPSQAGKGEGEDDLAARWKAALDDDELLEDEPTTDPSRFFDDDGVGFLEDDAAATFTNGAVKEEPAIDGASSPYGFHSAGHIPPNTSSQNRLDRYAPAQSPQQLQRSPPSPPLASSYLPTEQNMPFHTKSSQILSDFPSPYSQLQQRPQQLERQTHETPGAESFSDKSKGGYTSPYDLPMDVRPRKRASMQQFPTSIASQGQIQMPPPRSSSMHASPSSGIFPSPTVATSAPRPSPPIQNHPFQPPAGPLPVISSGALPKVSTPSSNSFFEELPVVSKPRHLGNQSKYTPQPIGTPPPFHTPQQEQSHPQQAPTPISYASLPTQQLLPPERVSPYAAPPHTSQSLPPPTISSSRYSPAPTPRSGAFQGQAKYTAIGGNAPPTPTTLLPHQPRIGSPLAHYEAQHPTQPPKGAAQKQHQETSGRPSSQGATARNVSSLGGVPREEEEMVFERDQVQHDHLDNRPQPLPHPTPTTGASRTSATPPPSNILSGQITSSPSKRATSIYAPQYQPSAPTAEPTFSPPRRAQTQSPGTSIAGPKMPTMPRDPYQRPSSVHGTGTPPAFINSYPSAPERAPARRLPPSPSYVTPTDGREADPLQRWKGCPIFVWGFGGVIVTSFPKEVPRYSSGQAQPLMTRSPGEVEIKSAKDVLPLEEKLARFPGPLKKAKKKEVLGWLTEVLESQEQDARGPGYGLTTAEVRKRHEEKLLLWKVLCILVEKDGILEGSPEVEKAVRAVLMPGAETGIGDPQSQYGGPPANISQLVDAKLQADPVDPITLETLRKVLLRGDREKAVWQAVDQRLWGHAMLISSTLNKETWKQVVQEFVRQEVKNLGGNTESLAALYEIFAGNVEESIDELVPPSARAGLQMVSTSANIGPTRNALEGLDRWRETLSLVLSNRSADDEQALLALGRLLAGYGRIEAAHLCFLFVRSLPTFGGADDPQTSFALLGTDHIQQPIHFAGNLESILLSEVLEFSASLTPSGHSSPTPHLQAYKLYHALVLADYGYCNEAQNYCAAITNGIRSTTKSSPYYHTGLLSILDDLTNRLQQSPKDSSGSWISKPSMEKVSGSMWAKFNSFVVGDESDAASTGSGKDGLPEIGPFSRIAGGTPSLSRTGSSVDLYSAAYTPRDSGPPLSAPPFSTENSRYAPKKTYEPQGPLLYDMQRVPSQEFGASVEPHPNSYDARRPADIIHGAHDVLQNDTSEPAKPQSSFQPTPQPAQSGNAAQQASFYPPYLAPSAQSQYAVITSDAVASSPYPSSIPSLKPGPPSDSSRSHQSYEPPQSDYHAPSSTEDSPGYDPPTYPGYEPPASSAPYIEAESGETSPVQEKPKKKTFYDDEEDDDLAARAAEIARKEKEQKEKEGKGKATTTGKQEALGERKSGWFGGWFGKKDPNASTGPIKAKLGEEISFYYDPEQKRWVNKKAEPNTPAPTATPPPPRGPTPRSFSGPPGTTSTSKPTHTPSAPPVSASPMPPPTVSAPPISINGLQPPYSAPPPSRSPSIPGTPPRTDSPSGSGPTASLAPPTPFSGPVGSAGGPPSRPSTALSDASSIEDLLGPPGTARKGGTVKKSKTKRGYVDVMAK